MTDISELGDLFIIQDIDANMIVSKRRELKRAVAIWIGVIGKEGLES